MEISNFLQEILYVIVLYNRRPKESASFLSLRSLEGLVPTQSIFIYDNTHKPASNLESGIVYRHDPNNAGVSVAYNQALVVAIERKKKWMLLLDQDTPLTQDFFRKLYESTRAYPESVAFVPVLKDSKGIVSPFRWWMGRGWRIDQCAEKLNLNKYRFANSGLLVQCDTFSKVGGYEEAIPLDFSDIAFGEKLKQVSPSFTTVDAVLHHSFSGTSLNSPEETLERFRLFCVGGFEYSRRIGTWLLHVGILWRALHLSLTLRNFAFMRILLAHYRGS